MYMLKEKDSKTKVCEMVSEFERNWKPANWKEASDRFVFDGFDSNTNNFDSKISWVERFRELLRKN